MLEKIKHAISTKNIHIIVLMWVFTVQQLYPCYFKITLIAVFCLNNWRSINKYACQESLHQNIQELFSLAMANCCKRVFGATNSS